MLYQVIHTYLTLINHTPQRRSYGCRIIECAKGVQFYMEATIL